MKKLLMLIGALIMSNAYGETVIWYTDANNISVNSCTAGGSITKPTNPTKSGYRFIGWKVANVNDAFFATAGTSFTKTDSGYTGTWTTTFPYGTVSGQSVLSSDFGAPMYNAQDPSNIYLSTFSTRETEPTAKRDVWCWCKATSATVKGVSVSVSPKWWLAYRFYSAGDAANDSCSKVCATNSYRTGFGYTDNKYLRKFVFTGSAY